MPREGYVTIDTIVNQDAQEANRIYNGAYDLESIEELLEIDGDSSSIKVADAEKITAFITKHPGWKFAQPYEGDTLYFFSTEPKGGVIENECMLHRGATAHITNCPKNVLLILDLD